MHKAKERLARMERRHLIAACLVVVIVAVAIVALTVMLIATTQKPAPSAITGFNVSGKIVCLPHKDTSKPHTLECAYGLHTDDNRYYALNYRPITNDTQVGDQVEVKGTLTTGNDAIYDITGTIKVDTLSQR